jgi:ribosomal protein L11 methyltransferase
VSAGRALTALDLHFPPRATHPDLPDQISLLLDDLAPAAIHEHGDDQRAVWRVFLTDPALVPDAAAAMTARFGVQGLHVESVLVEDEDWAARSQAHLTRVTVDAITVAPPWDAAAPDAGHLVVIHPSTGFGTGHHETTRLCLRLLQQVRVQGRRVLDLGTGSGVLALAAWRLGAREIEALDDDEDAIVNARENLALNNATDAISLRRADLRHDALAPADVVTANLTGAMLVTHAPMLAGLVADGGTLILSGLLATEADAVAAAFCGTLSLAGTLAEHEWRALRFERLAGG